MRRRSARTSRRPAPPGAAWPQRSPAALAVWLRAQDRSRRRTAARAPLITRTLLVDGAPAEFLYASAGQAWAAVRRHGELLLVVTARGVRPEDVAIEPDAAQGCR